MNFQTSLQDQTTIFKMDQSQNLVQNTVAQKLLIIQTFVPVYDQ